MLLKGLVRCKACGSKMTSFHAYGRNDKKYEYYRCTKAQHGGSSECPVAQVPARQLEQTVVARIHELADEPKLIQKAADKAIGDKQGRRPGLLDDLSEVKARMRKVSMEASKLLQAITGTMAQGISFVTARLNELDADHRQLQEQEAKLTYELGSLAGPNIDLEAARADLKAIAEVYEHLEQEDRQRLLRLAIREVLYDGINHKMQLSLHPWRDGGLVLDSYFRAVPIGSSGWTRTSNPSINSRMLHH